MTRVFLALIATTLLAADFPTAAGADGARHVAAMAGCFAVTYRFVEDGRHDSLSPDYGLEDPISERIELERGEDGALTLVHYSITEDGRAVAHFHEVWTRAPGTEAWRHQVWSHLPAHERSELRYQCTAPWQMNMWRCHAGPASKPFRDSGAPFGFDRPDYKVLDRDNRVLVTERGWVHSQHNRKLDEDGEVVAHELGWITYERIEDERCAATNGGAPEGDQQ